MGEAFNPAFHEAIGMIEGDPPDRIQAVVSSGLQLSDGTVLSPARVIVSTSPSI